MNLSGTQLKDTYGNLVTTGTTAGSPTEGGLQNGDGQLLTSVGIGTNLPASGGANTQNVHIHNPTANSTYLKLSTSGTGSSSSDGLDLAIDNSGNGYFINRENANIHFYTNSDEKLRIEADGDIAFYDDANNQGLFWDASTARLGLGTTSPGTDLEVNGDGLTFRLDGTANTARGILLRNVGTATGEIKTDGNLDINIEDAGRTMRFLNGNTPRMTIDSSGNVGIGTDSPSATLEILKNQSSATAINVLNNSSGGSARLRVGYDVSNCYDIFRAGSSADIIQNATQSSANIIWQVGGSENVRIDSSGNVGIGTTSPTDNLHVGTNSGGTQLKIESGLGTNCALIYETGGVDSWRLGMNLSGPTGSFQFYDDVANTTRMLIDSSGNVLVGTTQHRPANNNVNGVSIDSTYGIEASVTSGGALTANRKSTDGGIIEFQKDGTTVGSIGTFSSDLFIGTNDSGLRFEYAGTNAIVPFDVNSLAVSDNATDLGGSSARFKDLYLSGSVYLGGTTSANALDDYEEGTWTPTLTPSTSGTITLNSSSDVFQYTKIGRQVTILGLCSNLLTSSPVGDTIELGGLPFAIGDFTELSGRFVSSIYLNTSDSTANIRSGLRPVLGAEGNTTLTIYMDASTVTNNQSDLSFSITYFV